MRSYQGGELLGPQPPEAWSADDHLVLIGDGRGSPLIAALLASELLTRGMDARYPGPGGALLALAWSPFKLNRNVIFIGASDAVGSARGVRALLNLL
jgi:hypothetical protein